MTDLELKKLHVFCRANENDVKASGICGCFYCLRFFKPEEITEWVERATEQRWAMCPHCGTDSVLPGSRVTFTCDVLPAMHEYWFKNSSS